ncbi:MAG: hypothetical protein ACK53Y_15790, partial [bacterium]
GSPPALPTARTVQQSPSPLGKPSPAAHKQLPPQTLLPPKAQAAEMRQPVRLAVRWKTKNAWI